MADETIIDENVIKQIRQQLADRRWPVLQQLDGENIRNRYTIDRPEITFGRELTCEIVINDTKSSRRHAQIRYLNFADPHATPEVQLVDLKSTNGTFVNGHPITEYTLQDHDKITIGTTILSFTLRDESTLKAEQKLIELASSDALTGLNNRAVFDMQINREFERARRYERNLTLMMLDIDHFKVVNDTFGHPMGDQVLREVSQIILANQRSNDLAARYGGEEFAIILPETPVSKSPSKAQRLRKAVMEHLFGGEAAAVRATISVGLAGISDKMNHPADLIKLADQALYSAKQSGRNRVHWVSPLGQLEPAPEDMKTKV